MSVSRLQHISEIGVNHIGDRADAVNDPEMLRLENMDTDLAPPAVAVELTRRALNDDAANSYLPFEGRHALRQAAAAHVPRISGVYYPTHECQRRRRTQRRLEHSSRCRSSRVGKSSSPTRSTQDW